MVSLCLVLITGCWDSKELNDQALQVGAGIDLDENGGFVLSNQFALNSKGPSSEGNQQQASYTEVTKGENVFQASVSMQTRVTRKINRGQRTSLVLGEKVARQGIKKFIDIYTRVSEAQLRNDLFVVKDGLAVDLLRSTTPFGSLSQREYFKLHQAQNEIADTTFMNLLRSVNGHTKSGAIVPALEHIRTPFSKTQDERKEMQFAYSGIGIFDNELKLQGFLNNEEASEVLWLLKRGHTQSISAYIQEGYGLVTAQLSRLKCKMKPVFGENIEFRIALSGNADLMDNGTNLDLFQESNIKLIEQTMEKKAEKQFTQLIKKIQTEFKTDILEFGDTIFRKHPKQWRSLENRWEAEFPKVAVSVKVNIKVKRIGLTGAPVQMQEEEIKK